MECSEVRKFVYVYLDGEFEPRECGDFERHVQECAACRNTLLLERTFHALLRQRLDRPRAPTTLRVRILADIEHDDAQERGRGGRLLGRAIWWKALPALAAAALAVVLVWPRAPAGIEPAGSTPAATPAVSEGEPLETIAAESVAVHEVDLPAEVTGDAETIGHFAARNVSFHAIPPLRDDPSTQLIGVRRVSVGGVPALGYIYDHRGERLTVVQVPERRVRTQTPIQRVTYEGVGESPYSVTVFRDPKRRLYQSVVGYEDDDDLIDLIPASYTRP